MNKFWNELVKDGELVSKNCGTVSGKRKEELQRTDDKVKATFKVSTTTGQTSCNCPDQKLDHDMGEEEAKNIQRNSDEIIDSWIWGEQPSIYGLTEAIHSLMAEQLELTYKASKSAPSSLRLHQRLLILERYYIAYTSVSNIFVGKSCQSKNTKKTTNHLAIAGR